MSGFSSNEPIVAIATARGRAAIGVIRVTGANLEPIVNSVFRSRFRARRLRDRCPHLGDFLGEEGQVIDEGLLIWMDGPRSFTGEDVLELHCHGNPWILERMVHSVVAAGARIAEAGEFTRRAFLNGKMDLIQADAVMQLINATSQRGLEMARRLLNGELSVRLAAVKDALVDVLKWVEMAIDFPEEDIEAASEAELIAAIRRARDDLASLIQSFRQGRRARYGAVVAFCGRANVGKSSLFNRLLGFRRSIVADIPGTTRDMVESGFELGGVSVTLQDTAGLRQTLDSVEEEGIGMTRSAIGSADLVVLIADGSTEPDSEDLRILEEVRTSGNEWVGVLNKADLGISAGWSGYSEDWLRVSALLGDGVDAVRALMEERLAGEDSSDTLLLTSRWQKEILERMLGNLEGAETAIRHGYSPEATAFELYEALDRLDEVCGGSGREDVMNKVFSEFCLGK